ncbi:MAG: PLP-dependent lyase/thiolase [Patescibacteria group bacterium]|jgi:threonine dehydratase
MTPLNQINQIYLKREDQNPTGSAKDRAIVKQIKNLIANKYDRAVISSTGNAAISAIHYCQKFNIPLTIFLSPKVQTAKLNIIKKLCPHIIFSQKPISDAFKFSKINNSYYLRQSTDLSAQEGYQNISRELLEQLPQVSSIFVPVGSGTTLLGISRTLPSKTKIFAVQPASHCPISSVFDSNYKPENITVTDALSVKSLPLKTQLISTIKKTGGQGIVVQNQQVIDALSYLNQNNILSSAEGALAYAGLQKALSQKIDIGSYPVVLITGTKR